MKPSLFFVLLLAGLTVFLTACPGPSEPPPKTFQLTVDRAGEGDGVVESDPEGIDCGDNCQATFQEDSSVTLTATAGEGSTFAGFEGCTVDANNANACTVDMDAAKTVTATFDEEEPTEDGFTLSVTLAGNGIGTVTSEPAGISCGDDCSETFGEATSVVLTAAPTDANSQFTGFVGCTVDASDPNKCTVEVDDDAAAKEVTATFQPASAEQVALTVTKAGVGSGTVTSTPAGIDCGETCSADFTQGNPVTLTATPTDTNSEFAGFSDNCTVTDESAPNVCEVAMDEAKTVTATFNQAGNSGNVVVIIEGVGTNADQVNYVIETATGSDVYDDSDRPQYDPGTEVDISVRIGSSPTNFLGWGGDCSGEPTVSRGNPSLPRCILTLDTSANVVAIFGDGSEPTATSAIATGSDDAEEYLDINISNPSVNPGDVDLASGDLDLHFDNGSAGVGILTGLRFTGIQLPENATILYSYIQFRAKAASPADGSGTPNDPNDDLPPVNLVITGEKKTDSPTFFQARSNVSSRPDTEASVTWSPPAWPTGSDSPRVKRTSNLNDIVQEIAGQAGWDRTNGTMTFFIAPPKDESGDYQVNTQNWRQADSFESGGTPAPLVIIYQTP